MASAPIFHPPIFQPESKSFIQGINPNEIQTRLIIPPFLENNVSQSELLSFYVKQFTKSERTPGDSSIFRQTLFQGELLHFALVVIGKHNTFNNCSKWIESWKSVYPRASIILKPSLKIPKEEQSPLNLIKSTSVYNISANPILTTTNLNPHDKFNCLPYILYVFQLPITSNYQNGSQHKIELSLSIPAIDSQLLEPQNSEADNIITFEPMRAPPPNSFTFPKTSSKKYLYDLPPIEITPQMNEFHLILLNSSSRQQASPISFYPRKFTVEETISTTERNTSLINDLTNFTTSKEVLDKSNILSNYFPSHSKFINTASLSYTFNYTQPFSVVYNWYDHILHLELKNNTGIKLISVENIFIRGLVSISQSSLPFLIRGDESFGIAFQHNEVFNKDDSIDSTTEFKMTSLSQWLEDFNASHDFENIYFTDLIESHYKISKIPLAIKWRFAPLEEFCWSQLYIFYPKQGLDILEIDLNAEKIPTNYGGKYFLDAILRNTRSETLYLYLYSIPMSEPSLTQPLASNYEEFGTLEPRSERNLKLLCTKNDTHTFQVPSLFFWDTNVGLYFLFREHKFSTSISI